MSFTPFDAVTVLCPATCCERKFMQLNDVDMAAILMTVGFPIFGSLLLYFPPLFFESAHLFPNRAHGLQMTLSWGHSKSALNLNCNVLRFKTKLLHASVRKNQHFLVLMWQKCDVNRVNVLYVKVHGAKFHLGWKYCPAAERVSHTR